MQCDNEDKKRRKPTKVKKQLEESPSLDIRPTGEITESKRNTFSCRSENKISSNVRNFAYVSDVVEIIFRDDKD